MQNTLSNKEIEAKVLAYIDEHAKDAYTVLRNLIKIDTQNFTSYGNENNGQVYLAKVCREIGLDVDIYAPDSVPGLVSSDEYNPGRGTDKRENLVAVLRGEEDSNGVMLAAHMDTMPFGDISKWDAAPNSGAMKDGKIYGRGAGDDKSGLAISWFVLKALKECGVVPKKNVLLGSYVDEEHGGGNGALGLCLKYPSECYVNLDSKGLEVTATGGGCFNITVVTTQNDTGIASVFDVFDALTCIKNELEELNNHPDIRVRFSNFIGGRNGEKEGVINFAIYTNETKKATHKRLAEMFEHIKPRLAELKMTSKGFVDTTKFFRYGKTASDSKHVKLLAESIEEITGAYPDSSDTTLSDLSVFLHFGSPNSFNYGIPRGDENGSGAHQPNEFIRCRDLKNCIKEVALMVLRSEAY